MPRHTCLRRIAAALALSRRSDRSVAFHMLRRASGARFYNARSTIPPIRMLHDFPCAAARRHMHLRRINTALLRRSDRAVTVYSLAPRKRRSSNQLAPFAYHAMCLADTRRSKPSMAHPMSRSCAAQQHISMALQVRMSTATALSSQATTMSHFDPCPIHP